MKKVINCRKDNNPLIKQQLRKVSVEEGELIAAELFDILNKRKDGIGLAANQVGINASVAVVNVREPLVLINPVIEDQWDEIVYHEGCLSFPGEQKQTKRYKSVLVKTEQSDSGWYFSGTELDSNLKGSWEEKKNTEYDNELRLLEAICVQHEIDHLNGITVHDRQINTTIVSDAKVGRNEPCPCGSGKKYKKCCL